jgi:hypothetical protein
MDFSADSRAPGQALQAILKLTFWSLWYSSVNFGVHKTQDMATPDTERTSGCEEPPCIILIFLRVLGAGSGRRWIMV